LKNKKVYAFGDSIVFGHTDPDNAFMNMIEREKGILLEKYAVNGATVVRRTESDNDILAQLERAPDAKPDAVVFDGYTNDALGEVAVMERLGGIKGKNSVEFDITTFCGGFENIIYTMKKKWPDTPVVFVTIHKNGGREWAVQTKLRELAIKICGEWGVYVADVFADTVLDTRVDEQMKKYIIGAAGSHPNMAACSEFYVPVVTKKLEEALKK